jgi:DNA-binding NtrC family response regulator
LPAALDAIRELGAQIWAFSELGVGSTVRVFFRPAASVESSEAGAPAQTSGSETILLLDGDDEVRAAAARGLKLNGYRVLEARTAEEARRIAAGEKEIHLVITEVDPSEKNAPEAARALAEASNARLAYVSGETDAILANQGVLDRPELLLRKPYSAEQMALFVRTVLEDNQD